MARVMAIDYGTKRTGIAVTDETQTFAFGLTTVHTKDFFSYLSDYVNHNHVESFVVGEPRQLNDTPTDATVHIEGFIRKLKKEFPDLPVHRMDERFTSEIARQSIQAGGARKKERKNKALVDMVSATIILQSWLEKRRE